MTRGLLRRLETKQIISTDLITGPLSRYQLLRYPALIVTTTRPQPKHVRLASVWVSWESGHLNDDKTHTNADPASKQDLTPDDVSILLLCL